MREIWAELLMLDSVESDDDFFELGGFSILAIQVVGEVSERLGLTIDLGFVLEHPVLRDFVANLPAKASDDSDCEFPTETAEGFHPVTAQQQSMLELLDGPGNGLDYDLEWRFELDHDIDPALFAAAVSIVADAQPALRTRLTRSSDGGFQQFVVPTADATFRRTEATDSVLDSDLFGLRLTNGAGDQPATFTIRASHVIFDGWSLGLLLRSLEEAYDIVAGAHPTAGLATAPRMLYTNYARWQRRHRGSSEELAGWQWWDASLEGYTGPSAWIESFVAKTSRPTSFAADVVAVDLPPDVTSEVSRLARGLRITPFAVYLACFGAVLQAAKQDHDVVVGSSTATRDLAPMMNTIGYLANGRLTRISSASKSVGDLIDQCASWWAAAGTYPEIHMEQVVDRSGNPAFIDAKFSLQDAPGSGAPEIALGSVKATLRRETVDASVRRPLDVALTPRASGGAELRAVFRPDTLDRDAVTKFLDQFKWVLDRFITDLDADLTALRDHVRREFLS